MKRLVLLVTLFFVVAGIGLASEPAASAVLSKAEAQALQEHKQVLVIFHASWCGWCKRLDAFLADKDMGKLMTDNFVIVHLDVMEHDGKKDLENAGGEDLMKQWNGSKAGLPFLVILDPAGKKLADSNLTGEDGTNIGYPAKPEEIAHFMKMLKSAPNMSDESRTKIEGWLKANAPKSG
jgi:thioredoxin-related protein